jgi:predicted dehydrogenase
VLVPTPAHADIACRVLEAGRHLQVQKPIARDMAGADRILEAANATGATVSVLEDYLCFPPLMKLKQITESGEIGEPVGLHMKIVATGRGGWEVNAKSYEWQFEQSQDGRGMLVFDHGWHQLAVAQWLFGPIRRIYAWLGRTVIVPDVIEMDAPSTLVWEHDNGVRSVLEISFAVDTYFRSSHYTGDERVEVTGSKGYARCNRISAQGIQEPSVLVYSDGTTRGYHDIDDRPPDAFAEMARRSVSFFRGEAEPVMSGAQARSVLGALTAALESATAGRAVEVGE